MGVGAALVPLALGSDTNGSIRVPASFCGVFGLKPTYGRLPRTGTFPFCDSLDHLGPMARSVEDLALGFALMQGVDAGDHACQPVENVDCSLSILRQGVEGLRVKRAGGFFDAEEFPAAQRAVDKVCELLGISQEVDLPGAHEARAAAYLITNVEGSRLHLGRLKRRAADFDPDTRDRFIAGAMLPAAWYVRAQQVRHGFHRQAMEVFESTDIIVAPATPCVAPRIGEKYITLRGERQLVRPNLGLFTQPVSAIGLPSCVVPTLDDESGLPIGVQVIAAPWREDVCLRVAYALEQLGLRVREPLF